MYKNELLNLLKHENRLVFTTAGISQLIGLKGPSLSNLLESMVRQGYLGSISKGRYYFKGAQIRDVFAIASKIVSPSYIGTESAFERYGLSDVIPKIIRVITTRAHRPIKTNEGKITFIRFKKERFFGYNESRWISISSLEKAFVDSLYLGEFPFFTDLVNYHSKLENFGYRLDCDRLVEYALRMKSDALANRVGFFLEHVGEGDYSARLLSHTYRKRRIPADHSGQGSFDSKKWMIE